MYRRENGRLQVFSHQIVNLDGHVLACKEKTCMFKACRSIRLEGEAEDKSMMEYVCERACMCVCVHVCVCVCVCVCVGVCVGVCFLVGLRIPCYGSNAYPCGAPLSSD